MIALLDIFPGRGRLAILPRRARLDLAAGFSKTNPFFNTGLILPSQTGLKPLSFKVIKAFSS